MTSKPKQRNLTIAYSLLSLNVIAFSYRLMVYGPSISMFVVHVGFLLSMGTYAVGIYLKKSENEKS
ncbi:MAG: hypothetical protein RIG77_01305 [Cyclobacteriaceae bacterium]